MARRVFFSFHYENDIWRSSVVRNSWLTKEDREDAGFFDASIWEEAKIKGKAAVHKLIDSALENTSVTVVLIGSETSDREYVLYEIVQSWNRGNGVLGIYVHNIKDQNQKTTTKGANPFDNVTLGDDGTKLSSKVKTYNWVSDDGYNKLGDWVESAAKARGK